MYAAINDTDHPIAMQPNTTYTGSATPSIPVESNSAYAKTLRHLMENNETYATIIDADDTTPEPNTPGIPVESNTAYTTTPSVPVEPNTAYTTTPSVPVESNSAYAKTLRH